MDNAKPLLLGVGLGVGLALAYRKVHESLAPASRPRRRARNVAVGTQNKCKLAAVHAVMAGDSIEGFKVPSGISEQPMSLEETCQGACNRAKAALQQSGGRATIALGIESGLFHQPGGSWYDVCCCAILSAETGTFHLGFSCAFRIPTAVMRRIESGESADLTIACNDVGITDDPNLGEHGGLIGILSNGRITRSQYTEQAIACAMMQLDNAQWYVESRPNTPIQQYTD